ncbi:hypothetical protein JCM11251_006640 [Rhodosporidiobolus azoricus]
MRSAMADLDPSLLLRAHTLLSGLAALSSAPIWNIPVSLYGLAVIHQEGAQAGEAVRTFIAVLGGSFLLDVIWFVSNSTHGLARLVVLLNLLLKPVTIFSTLAHLRSRGEHGPSFQGFSVPSSISDRIPGGFPPFGHRQQQSETVFQQPSSVPGSYHQPRFSIDEDLEAGAGSGASTPSTNTAMGTNPLFSPAPLSSAGGAKKGGKKAGAAAAVEEERPAPPYRAGSTTAAEGGGYHSLE